LVSKTTDAELFALGDQIPYLVEQLIRGHGHSARIGASLRFGRTSGAPGRES
jgi:hypothetical protein